MNKEDFRSGGKRHIADIEVLRAIAILLVVVHHAEGNLFPWKWEALHNLNYILQGWSGVDLFFVISGFVIARDLLPKLSRVIESNQSTRIVVFAFWMRRFFRIFPSMFAWLLLILMACLFFNNSHAFGSFDANVSATLASIFQYANIRFAMNFGVSEIGASFAFWSLALEEQFYLLLPLVIIVLRRWFVFVLIGVIVIQAIQERFLIGTVLRSEGLAMGVLLAIFLGQESLRIQAYEKKWVVIPLIYLFLMLFIWAAGYEYPFVSAKYTVLAILGTILVFLASFDVGIFGRFRKLSSVFYWIGSRSYAIYLCHVPMFFLTREVLGRIKGSYNFDVTDAGAMGLTALCLILVFAEINYRLIEMPLRRYGVNLSSRLLNTELRPS